MARKGARASLDPRRCATDCAGGVQADGCLLAATKKVTAKGGNQGMGVAGETSASARSGSEQAREEQKQEPRVKKAARRKLSPTVPPRHDLRHVSTLAPELGVLKDSYA